MHYRTSKQISKLGFDKLKLGSVRLYFELKAFRSFSLVELASNNRSCLPLTSVKVGNPHNEGRSFTVICSESG